MTKKIPVATPAKKNRAAQALGRLGGSANTAAQQRARKKNAQNAGRPRRVCTDCGKPVFGWHQERKQDAKCEGRTWTWQKRSEQ